MHFSSKNGNVYLETVNGEEKVLRLDFNAVADLEALFDKGITALLNEQNIGFNIIRGFYWAALKGRDRKMTLKKAGDFVQTQISGGVDIEELMEPVVEAMIASGILNRTKEKEEELDESEEVDIEDEEEVKN